MWEARGERAVITAALVSCAYVPVIVALVSVSGRLYDVGKRTALYLPALLLLGELVRLALLPLPTARAPRRRSERPAGDILKCLALTLISVGAFFGGVVLFGAPALDRHEETLMLSLVLATLAVFPLARRVGAESALQLLSGSRSAAGDPSTEMLIRNAAATVCGAWLGAVVIPLDWDRPWQAWPVPCYLGALAGYVGSNIVTIIQNLTSIKIPI